jgi:hypothetical protein
MGLPKSMIVLPLMLALASGDARAQWPLEPDSSLQISAPGQYAKSVSMLPDGVGGAFMAWRTGTYCPGYPDDVRFLRVSADGLLSWQTGSSDGESTQPAMAPDGHGGIIAVWKAGVLPTGSSSSYSYTWLRGQRFDASGTAQWAANTDIVHPFPGEATNECVSSYFPYLPSPRIPLLVSDGEDGAIAAWQDADLVYVQRITRSGEADWEPNSLWVGFASSYRSLNAISDQHEGAIVVFGQYDSVYAQRVDSKGLLLWGTVNSPVAIGLATPELHQPSVASDDSGGVIVAWLSKSIGSPTKRVLAQRVDAAGRLRWGSDGISVCPSQSTLFGLPPAIVSDGAGGAIIAWSDHRHATASWTFGAQVYAQRIARSGSTLWQQDGVLLSGAPDTVSDCTIGTDGRGGAIVAWTRWLSYYSANQIWTQRVDANGAGHWGGSGRMLASTAPRRRFPQLVSDGMGGAIVAWETNQSIEVLRIRSTGEPVFGVAADSPGSIVAMPNPTRQEASFRMSLHRPGHATVSIHDLVGRRVRNLFDGDLEAGERWVAWDGRDDNGNRVRPGVYFARVNHPGTRAIGRVILLP